MTLRDLLEKYTHLNARAATLVSLGLATGFCVALVAARTVYTGNTYTSFLVWNLFLAWIPFLVALVVYDRSKRGSRSPALVALAAVWLLFFPNAPYIVTDLVHLKPTPSVPLWFDVISISASAWIGLLLGFVSLYLMQSVAKRVVGAAWSWVLVLAALGLSSFGIYLGRFERLNSWDVVLRPTRFFEEVWAGLAHPIAYPRTLAVTILLTSFLAVSYFILYNFARLRPE